MIHVSWVSPAWVLRAISGSATFSDDIAETTAARAMHTTAVIARWWEGSPGRPVRSSFISVVLICFAFLIWSGVLMFWNQTPNHGTLLDQVQEETRRRRHNQPHATREAAHATGQPTARSGRSHPSRDPSQAPGRRERGVRGERVPRGDGLPDR